jgi:uncharacterized protein (UPF0332 family)
MTDRATVYLEKAQESVAGAQSELANGRYNNCANLAYYACYQAAIHALIEAGIHPPKATDQWGHGFVQARFNDDLINRRKRYPPDIRGTLEHNHRLRETAKYNRRNRVTELQAARAFRRAQAFVTAVAGEESVDSEPRRRNPTRKPG